MNFGASAESFSASRSLLMALFNPWSKSTNVSVGQSLCRNSSRVTIPPGCSSSIARIWSGWSCSRILRPFLRSSPARKSTSYGPNRTLRADTEGLDIRTARFAAEFITPNSARKARSVSLQSAPSACLLREIAREIHRRNTGFLRDGFVLRAARRSTCSQEQKRRRQT